MEIKRIAIPPPTYPDKLVQVKKAGHTTEIRSMTGSPEISIQRLDKDTYVDIRTGEVKDVQHRENRIEDKSSIRRSMRELRDIINTNVTKPRNCIWLTLTYKENMQNTQRLYNDTRKFFQRLRYYLKQHNQPDFEYITTAEPQARGAWHLHTILIFAERAPFIANEVMASLWKHGFTRTKSLKNVDNVGLYLTAYLTNMELDAAVSTLGVSHIRPDAITKAESIDTDGKRHTKAFVKGARLELYPAGFRLYRTSRGIKRPAIEVCTEQEAQAMIGNTPLMYEQTLQVVVDSGEVVNTIHYRQYNRAAKRVSRKKHKPTHDRNEKEKPLT